MNLPPYGSINVSSEEIRSSLGLINDLVIRTICVCVLRTCQWPRSCLLYWHTNFGLLCMCVSVCACVCECACYGGGEGEEKALSESWLLSQSHFSA